MKDLSAARHPWLRVPDVIAIGLIAVVVILATVVAIAESYRNLWVVAGWSGLHGFWQAIAPAVVDSFIIVGEALLFVALARNWRDWPIRLYGWSLALGGFAVSLAGNVYARPVFALFPVAATAGLAAGLMVVKRVAMGYREMNPGTWAAVKPSVPLEPSREPPARAAQVTAPAVQELVRSQPKPMVPVVQEPVRSEPKPAAAVTMTPEIQADLAAGLSAQKLVLKYPEQLTLWTAGQLVKHRKQLALNGSAPAQEKEEEISDG
jgi:uncharacterized protein DUF2637